MSPKNEIQPLRKRPSRRLNLPLPLAFLSVIPEGNLLSPFLFFVSFG
jgi:hypothetical protein